MQGGGGGGGGGLAVVDLPGREEGAADGRESLYMGLSMGDLIKPHSKRTWAVVVLEWASGRALHFPTSWAFFSWPEQCWIDGRSGAPVQNPPRLSCIVVACCSRPGAPPPRGMQAAIQRGEPCSSLGGGSKDERLHMEKGGRVREIWGMREP